MNWFSATQLSAEKLTANWSGASTGGWPDVQGGNWPGVSIDGMFRSVDGMFLFGAELPPPQAGVGTLLALLIFILGSLWIGVLANRAMQSGGFLQGFFLGNRGLGAWALALTATVQSGGTFMGFPSLVYSYGWVVALWICSYMVVPISGFAILGKRLAQLSRMTSAITVPDLWRGRFESPALGMVASFAIMFFMTFMMMAQFKAGALVMKLSIPGTGALALVEDAAGGIDSAYYIGLGVFTATVLTYTLCGGFLAAVWTDLFQSVMMLIGVMMLLCLTLYHAGGLPAGNQIAIQKTSIEFAAPPGYDASRKQMPPEQPAANANASIASVVDATKRASIEYREFLTLPLAASFFLQWVFAGVGSPAGMVRIMAGKDTTVIRRSIPLLSVYNLCIYPPLIIICICGRSLIPDLAGKSDEIIPRLALLTTAEIPGGSFLAGLILAAPFGAVMATVSSYLVLISSSIVRDVYQRSIRPHAETAELRFVSRTAMIGLGVLGVASAINPPKFLQVLVVFSGTGAGCTFCVPAIMLAYWRRANTPGMLASMLSGGGVVIMLYLAGIFGLTPPQALGPAGGFKPYYLAGFDPVVWGLLASLMMGVCVTLITAAPDERLVAKFFDEKSPTTA